MIDALLIRQTFDEAEHCRFQEKYGGENFAI